ncbi:(d)CMP kinase [Balneolaceae bacterium ANBcel3]|nr:(d)CMP kinase [Balneolaceae bacterium ANBcel3]
MIIVIDGPAGSGKSSTAKAVARKTGYDYVDSGAIYRALAYLYNTLGKDQRSLLEKLEDHQLHFDFNHTDVRVRHMDTDITEAIRSMPVNQSVSEVAAMPEVREVVRKLLRDITQGKNAVLDGRDLGTVVFPDADLKIFLTADLETRAARRFEELSGQPFEGSLEEIKTNLQKRDTLDSQREVAPLRKADDAMIVDSTHLSFDEQVARILNYIRT